MIRNCKNCAGRIKFDIKSGGLKCDSCESIFNVKEYGNKNSSNEIECEIYSCSTCGAEVIMNNTESSTFCIYCGNPTVIISRIEKNKKPEVIIPFEITAEEAVNNIRKQFEKGFFIPDVVHPEISDMRGIYIPYYVTNVEFDGSLVITNTDKHGSHYHLRNGYCSANWVTTDASKKLNDTFSRKLEPYYFDKFKEFDEDYLLGFYSDIADVDESEAISTARSRVIAMADRKFMNTIEYTNSATKKRHRYITEVYDKPITAMLPAWFYTYQYKGKPYTIAVNGQTGRVAGGVPWNKTKFNILTAALALVISFLCFSPFLFTSIFGVNFFLYILYPILLILLIVCPIVYLKGRKIFLDSNGKNRMIDMIYSKNSASATSLVNYVNKRQGDK